MRSIALGPDHASLYILELYPNAPLRDAMARSKWSLAPDDDAAEMYLEAMARLDAAGYEQYEISNVAQARARVAPQPEILDRRRVAWLRLRRAFHPPRRPLEEPVVNDRVHRRCGVGRSARRRSGGSSHGREALEEALFTGLRLTRGIDVHAVKIRYDADVWGIYGARTGAVPRGRLVDL